MAQIIFILPTSNQSSSSGAPIGLSAHSSFVVGCENSSMSTGPGDGCPGVSDPVGLTNQAVLQVLSEEEAL